MKTNWKTKLKTVLEKDEFSEVSLKKALTKADKTKSEVVLSAFVSAYLVDTPKNFDELSEIKTDKFHEILNQLIESGIAFDVSTDDFQVIDEAQILKTSDRDFLEINNADILCQLQQSLLMKHLFSIAPEQFEDFASEIYKRESLLTITDKTIFQIYCEAVKDTTKKWYNGLLEQLII